MTTERGTLGGMAKRRRDPQPVPPPRPTVEDVDAWLRQIDDVLEGLPMEGHQQEREAS